jgi:murein DD-endopeptidase MepM/ murein hydrolase activator NlpD
MRRYLPLLLVPALLLLPTPVARLIERPAEALATPPLNIVHGVIPPRTSLSSALGEHLAPAALHALVEAARPLHDLARIAPGHTFGLAVDGAGTLRAFTYAIDELKTLRVERQKDALAAEVVAREYEVRTCGVSGVISSSLFATIGDLGEDDQLALDLAEIFAWDVDFNTEIQSGDSFRVAVEKLYLDGSFRRYGRILAAEFTRGPRRLSAVRFEGRTGLGFYALDGTPLRKAFLRSPIKFGHITSRFTHARLHPILKIVRPHLGIDYGAPVGTPVMAAADGVVTAAGWSGGFGKTVRVRHANGIETLYGHLSRIGVRAGQRVQQGTSIGAVGATGLASGPHLDYRMYRAGRAVNPLSVQLPPAPPIPDDERAAFATASAAQVKLLPPSAAEPRRAGATR